MMKWLTLASMIALLGAGARAETFINKFGFRIPDEGVFRTCIIQKDCAPSANCAALQDSPCSVTRECRRCFSVLNLKNCVNDPICEAQKAAERAACQSQNSARKAQCEIDKLAGRAKCEAERAELLNRCHSTKKQEELRITGLIEKITPDVLREGRPMRVPASFGWPAKQIISREEVSALQFFVVPPDGILDGILAYLFYGRALLKKADVPDVAWIGPVEASSFKISTKIVYGHDILVRDVVRAAIASRVFQMKPAELAQLILSNAFDMDAFLQKAVDQTCQSEEFVDQKVDCKASLRLVQ